MTQQNLERIALISDIHGNLTALDTVLEQIAAEDIERIICLGDVSGGGPCPREVLTRLRELQIPVILGNADEWLLDPQSRGLKDEEQQRMEEIDRWCAAQLDEGNRHYIRAMAPTIDLSLGPYTLRCFHGSPRSNREIIRAATPDDEVTEQIQPMTAMIYAGGHTHEPLVRSLWDVVLVNPGSVGLPFSRLPEGGARNQPWAEWAVLGTVNGELRVELRRTPVDGGDIQNAILESGMPHAAWWAAEWSE